MKSLLGTFLFCLLACATNGLICPDGSSCPDANTCCEVGASKYGCCPLPNAVCCDDQVHCCPDGYTCGEGLCTKQHSPRRNNGSNIVCPDRKFSCPDGNTCCPAGDAYTCCPLPDATCCSDGAHCCPSGTTCDLAHETCNVPIMKIAETVFPPRHSNPTVVVCPGGEYQCPDSTTCCLLASGAYGCCPLPDAVCCQDKIHCCPTGYKCSQGTCVQAAPAGLASTAFPPVAIVENPTGQAGVDCPDGKSKCPTGNTCCMLSTGRYGCCPLEEANCCPDHIHCCPKGSQCDMAKSACDYGSSDQNQPLLSTPASYPPLLSSPASYLLRHKTTAVIPWFTKVPAMPRVQTTDVEPENGTNDV